MADARATSPGEPGVYLVSDPSSRHHYVGMAEGIQGIRGRIGNQGTKDETVKEKFRRAERPGRGMHPRNRNMALEEFGLEKRNFNSTELGAAVVRYIDQVPGMEVRWYNDRRRWGEPHEREVDLCGSRQSRYPNASSQEKVHEHKPPG